MSHLLGIEGAEHGVKQSSTTSATVLVELEEEHHGREEHTSPYPGSGPP